MKKVIRIYNQVDIALVILGAILTIIAMYSISADGGKLMLIQSGVKCIDKVCEPVYSINGLAFIGAIVWVGLPLYFTLTKKIKSYPVKIEVLR